MKQLKREKTKARIRRKIYGTSDAPRLSVFKSLKALSVQVIDDDQSKTLCGVMVKKKNIEGAKELAGKVVEKLKQANIKKVKFDRNGYIYQGVVKELADGIRSGDVKF